LNQKKSLGLSGEIKVPGDKSISHRALIIGSMVNGKIKIKNLLESEDVIATANALKQLDVKINKVTQNEWEVFGNGIGCLEGSNPLLDMGNSGTGVRLLMGLVAGSDVEATFTGDKSLSKRPMERIIKPLIMNGAFVHNENNNTLPIRIKGNRIPLPIKYHSPVASAQVKSAIFLAGLSSLGKTTVIEPSLSRDHTERLLKYLGAVVITNQLPDLSWEIILQGMPELNPLDISVPSDPSSAAFPIVTAIITPKSEVLVKNVCINKLRIGLYKTLIEMGANIKFLNEREIDGENIADISAKSSSLIGITVPKSRAPSMIDEYPILAVAASIANGVTIMEGVQELRYKETDRIKAMAEGLSSMGIQTHNTEDSLTIYGKGTSSLIEGGVNIHSMLDHRIAMSFLCLGLISKKPIIVNDTDTISSSFPNFFDEMNKIGAKLNYI
jgi:3-phosphoshikimate 1-carboxyvinyltransferase